MVDKPSGIIHIPRRYVIEEWGGTETVISQTSKALMNMGYECEIHTSLALSDRKFEEIYGVPVYRHSYSYTRLGLKKRNRLILDKRAGDLYSPGLFWAALTRKNVKIFHLHTMGRIGALTRLAAKIRKIPYVVSIHGGHFDLPKAELEKMLAPLRGSFNWGKPLDMLLGRDRVLAEANAIVCVNRAESEKMQAKFPGKPVIHLPNGVDLARFEQGDRHQFREAHRIGKDDFMVLAVGSFYAQKNQQFLLDAFINFKKKVFNAKMVFIGVVYDQDYFNELEAKIAAAGLTEDVVLIKNVKFDSPELPDAYAAADLFVLPSKYETFGIVVLEAWAARKPVLCAKVGGLADLMVDGDSGRFFDLESVADLTEKIHAVAADRELAEGLAAGGFRRVQEYSWENITAKLAELYERLSKND